MRFLLHPKTGKPDMMITLSTVAVIAAVVKFLVDGLQFTINGHIFNFGHLESMAYGSLLAPILGAHSYLDSRPSKPIPENPDGIN